MKQFVKLSVVAAIAVAFTSCMQSPKGEKAKTGDALEISFPKDAQVLNVDVSTSAIEWLGTKPTGTHFGTLSLRDGKLYIKDNQLLGGEVTMDMNSIVVLDIQDAKMNQGLLGHLRSADFFFVDSFPTATFKFANVIKLEKTETTPDEIIPSHRIEGNLTLRGVTKKVNFPASIELTGENVSAKTPQFIINRTDWNVNYGSKSVFANLKDNFIHDEMGIKISLKAN